MLDGHQKGEYEASNDSKSREQELELMEALRALISKDDSALAWAKRKDALALSGSWWIASPLLCWENV